MGLKLISKLFGYVIFKWPESTLNLYFVLTIINKTCFVIEIFRSLNKWGRTLYGTQVYRFFVIMHRSNN